MITNNLYVIAAICGNFWRESNVNPGIWENLTVGSPGYGLGQWTDVPPGLTRRTQLFNWLSMNGYPQDSGIGQLEYLLYEDYWVPVNAYDSSPYPTLTDFIQTTSTNLNDLVYQYMWHWEGINDSGVNIRLNAAADFLHEFQNDPGTRDPWYSGNFYLTTAQALNNALLVMDWFLGGSPPGPGPSGDELPVIIAAFLKKKRKGGGYRVF